MLVIFNELLADEPEDVVWARIQLTFREAQKRKALDRMLDEQAEAA